MDGFLNGMMSTVAGIGAMVFPLVVPLLAKALPSLGFQCLMAATLAMAVLQMVALGAMMVLGRAIKAGGRGRGRESRLTEPLLMEGGGTA